MSERAVAIRLPPVEWLKLVGLIGAQLVAVVIYIQAIDHKATTARDAAIEAKAEVRELRDRTDTKLEKLNDKAEQIGKDVAEIKAAVKQRTN